MPPKGRPRVWELFDLSDYPDLLILRHGETEWNAKGRLQGALNSPLTAKGEDQARAQGAILGAMIEAGWPLAEWDIRTSSQGRSRHTAELALTPLGLSAREDTRLREIDVGTWSGLLRSEIRAQAPGVEEVEGVGVYDLAPGGEGIAGLEVRAARILESLTGPSILFTHGITSRVLRCLCLGLPASDFDQVEGGQGILFFVSNGKSQKLTLQSPIPSG